MTTLNFATQALAIVGLVVEGLCVLSFVLAGKVRKLPLVFTFLIYLFASDAFLIWLAQKSDVWSMLVITTYVGYIFEAAAIWELACSLLGSVGHAGIARKWRLTVLFCIVGGLATYLMTNMESYLEFGLAEQRFLHVELAASIFRLVGFLAILVLLRFSDSEEHALTSRVTFVFGAYAFCEMLRHILDELVPRLRLSVETYEVDDCVSGFIWVFLLLFLTWYLLRSLSTRAAPPKLNEVRDLN